jgi:hypothetical protein
MTNTDPAATPAPATAPISSPMIGAIERAWEAVRANHPELPHVVIIMGGGLVPGGIKLGHFAADRWAHREQGSENALDVGPAAAETYSELFVGGEGLARQPHEVMATLLHEAAHCLAHVRGIQDTSRQGRWHNRAFATLAAEMGITVEKDRKIGYSITSIPDETVAKYMGTIMELELALTHIRTIPAMAKIVQPVTPAPVGGGVAVAPAPVRAKRPGATCDCGREVHIARAALAEAAILCGLCMSPFTYA